MGIPAAVLMLIASSTAMTGGVVVHNSSASTGGSYSSVQVTTVSNGAGATVNVDTNLNGQKHHEVLHPGPGAGVSVVASSTGYSAKILQVAGTTAGGQAFVAATSTLQKPPPPAFINWFSRLFHWVIWW